DDEELDEGEALATGALHAASPRGRDGRPRAAREQRPEPPPSSRRIRCEEAHEHDRACRAPRPLSVGLPERLLKPGPQSRERCKDRPPRRILSSDGTPTPRGTRRTAD